MNLVLLLAAAALASPVQSANVNRKLKLLPSNLIGDSTESNSKTPRQKLLRKSLQVTRHSAAVVRHEAGRTLQLRCDANGAPAPAVRWLKNNQPITEYVQDSNELIETNPTSFGQIRSILLITRPSATSDVYTCVVTSGRRSESFSSVVHSVGSTTSDRYKLLPLEPRIVTSYKVYMDFIGNNMVLPCKAKGHPRPLVTWYDSNGEQIRSDDPRRKVLRSGELLVAPLRWADMGSATCRATNSFGSRNASTFIYPIKTG